jgi:hypothetical protein
LLSTTPKDIPRVVVVGASTKVLAPPKLAAKLISLAVSVVAPKALAEAPKLIVLVPACTASELELPVMAPFI